MGRQVRMVPANWQHPKNEDDNYIPLLNGSFKSDDETWNKEYEMWQQGYKFDYFTKTFKKHTETCSYTYWAGERPNPDNYMPVFPEGTANYLMMYEDTSEGTPISPSFKTPEELARWLADNEASAFGNLTASYEQWFQACKQGWAVSMIIDNNGIHAGVGY